LSAIFHNQSESPRALAYHEYDSKSGKTGAGAFWRCTLAFAFGLGVLTASALAESDGAKALGNEVVERNAEHYFGELGMYRVEPAA
jgi:hypothetical protein